MECCKAEMHIKKSELQSPGCGGYCEGRFLKISSTIWQRFETHSMKQEDAYREQENSYQAHSIMAREDVDSERDSSDHSNAPVNSDCDTNTTTDSSLDCDAY